VSKAYRIKVYRFHIHNAGDIDREDQKYYSHHGDEANNK
jgi:hypothetical protein